MCSCGLSAINAIGCAEAASILLKTSLAVEAAAVASETGRLVLQCVAPGNIAMGIATVVAARGQNIHKVNAIVGVCASRTMMSVKRLAWQPAVRFGHGPLDQTFTSHVFDIQMWNWQYACRNVTHRYQESAVFACLNAHLTLPVQAAGTEAEEQERVEYKKPFLHGTAHPRKVLVRGARSAPLEVRANQKENFLARTHRGVTG